MLKTPETDDDKHVKRVNFEEDDDTGEEFLFERDNEEEESKDACPLPSVLSQEERESEAEETEEFEEEEELSAIDQVTRLSSIISMSTAFDEEDVALLASQKAKLLKDDLKSRTLTKALAQAHFQSTIEEREKVLTNAVKTKLLIPGTETFSFFVKKQAKLVDLAQKLY